MFGNKYFNRGLYFDKAADKGGEIPDPEKKDDKPGDAPEAEKDKGKSGQVVFESEEALQKEIDKRLKDRLAREEKKREEATKKAKEDAEANSLAEQKKFEELANKRQTKIDELTQRIGEIEPSVKRFETALTKFRDAQLGEVPEHLKPLLEKLDVVDQIEWLAVNKEKLKATPSGVPPTPPPAGDKELDEAAKGKAREQNTRTYQSQF